MFTAPFHKVGFADFWLADQLNSLVVILMDLEYMICFYSFEVQWEDNAGLLANTGNAGNPCERGQNDLKTTEQGNFISIYMF